MTAAILTGCSKDEDIGGENDLTAATFNAGITATRTTDGGNSWTTTDRVGIFMVPAGGSLTTAADVLANNVEHTVTNTTTGALMPASGTIYYPQAGNVDFMAYYPYTGTTGTGAGQINNYTYTVWVAGQTNEAAQNALDLLYAKRTGVAKTKTAVGLTFGHVLSKVTLHITLGNGLTSLTGADITEVSLTKMPLTATLALQDGTLTAGAAGGFVALKAATPTAPAVATFTAIIVPQPQTGTGDFTARTALFTVAGETYAWAIPNEETFIAGNHYTYPVTVQRAGVTVGTPTITDWDTNDNGTASMEMSTMHIPAGTFLMGSSDGSNTGDTDGTGLNTTAFEPNRITNETQHKVTLTQDFYMSKYPITNSQYTAFLNAKGIGSDGQGSVTYDYNGASTTQAQRFILSHQWGVTYDNSAWKAQTNYESHPVINVTWYGAKAYADWVGGRLPTEAQWEYACRGGQHESLPFGIDTGRKLTGDMANFYATNPYDLDYSPGGSYNEPTQSTYYKEVTTAVGAYPYANGYGLYDMHGNVWEWCLDQWDGSSNNYTSLSATDPLCTEGIYRVIRGGSWEGNAQYCRSACRVNTGPDNANYITGFRVVFVQNINR